MAINQYRRTDGRLFEAEEGSAVDHMMTAASIFELILQGAKTAQNVVETIEKAKSLTKGKKTSRGAGNAQEKGKE